MAADLCLTLEEKSEPSNGGRPFKIFISRKRETLILVSGYSVAMRARIIDRCQELEDPARNLIASMSRFDLLKIALDSEEKRQALEQKVGAMAESSTIMRPKRDDDD